MNSLLRIVVLHALCFLLVNTFFATGAKVTLSLLSGESVTGELLALSDSTLILSSETGLPEDKLEADTSTLIRVKLCTIEHVVLCGKSYLADGILLGVVGGIAIGALVAYAPEGHDSGGNTNLDASGPGAGAMVVGILAGSALGGFFGHMSTTNDRELNQEQWRKIPFLRALTRYHDKTIPDFLQKYIAEG